MSKQSNAYLMINGVPSFEPAVPIARRAVVFFFCTIFCFFHSKYYFMVIILHVEFQFGNLMKFFFLIKTRNSKLPCFLKNKVDLKKKEVKLRLFPNVS